MTIAFCFVKRTTVDSTLTLHPTASTRLLQVQHEPGILSKTLTGLAGFYKILSFLPNYGIRGPPQEIPASPLI
ncbi:hypothetical protein [Pseudogulbenkiania sp. NH8B]|uniref:hypothetical protein n=1 Tax=Pseudogulbenkiania sp. (strain NH8B) TaxID=748280 RepID=UPI0011D2906C|nr:hypothetical protein [Pseudogulbenkiania sp. NH8B]